MSATGTALQLAAAAGAAVLLAGCGGVPAPPDSIARHETHTDSPLPSGAVPLATPNASAPPAPNCSNPTASLRPFPDPAAPPPSAALDAIRAHGRLIVGLDTGSNLFSFRDPVSGNIEGFDVDIAKEIAADLFGDRERVEYRLLNSADREKALQNRTVDIVAKTMTINCQRRERVTFSTVYYQANQRVLALRNSGIEGIADLAGKQVCVLDNTTSLQHLRQDQPAASILTVRTWADCLVVLQQRQVDAVSTDDSILAGLAAQDPYLQVVGGSISPEPYGIGIAKDNDDLVRFVNGTLQRIRADGTWNRIYQRWLTVLGPSPGPPLPNYRD